MQTKGFACQFTGFCTKRRVGVKPCLLETNSVHCVGLERLGWGGAALRKGFKEDQSLSRKVSDQFLRAIF